MRRLVLVILALAFADPAAANVGRKHFPGTPTTEPNGLREIAIEREELSFDLRPLDAHGPAKVSASYHLNNTSAAIVTAPLVFVSGASVPGGIDVAFDGVRVHGESLSDEQLAALPPSWRAPSSTPAIDGDRAHGYATGRNSALAFTLAIPPGRHQLIVRYPATAQVSKSSDGGTLRYQLGYVLAPARDWGSFGTLDVTVDVPAGWRVATSPSLARTGDTLRGRFPSLPADTLGITVQAPTGTLHAVLQYALPLLALLVLIGGGFVLFAIGRARGRRTEDLRSLWPVSLPVSLVWAVAIAITGGLAAIRSELAIPEGQSAAHGYGGAFGILFAILVALIAIPVGVLIAKAGSSRGSHATRL
ncbi:MAG: hypothetical protein M4D80_24650 [Myxococcota bacterium]|nr:hypothetical protein [Myxococcota bacterium]